MKNLKDFLLNTPEKYWLVISGYHIHKSFWGLIFLILGMIFIIFHKLFIGFGLLIIGDVLIILSIIGQKYTHGKYRLELWERYKKKPRT